MYYLPLFYSLLSCWIVGDAEQTTCKTLLYGLQHLPSIATFIWRNYSRNYGPWIDQPVCNSLELASMDVLAICGIISWLYYSSGTLYKGIKVPEETYSPIFQTNVMFTHRCRVAVSLQGAPFVHSTFLYLLRFFFFSPGHFLSARFTLSV